MTWRPRCAAAEWLLALAVAVALLLACAARATEADSAAAAAAPEEAGLVGPIVVAVIAVGLVWHFFIREPAPVQMTTVPTFQAVPARGGRSAGAASSSGGGGRSLVDAVVNDGKNLLIVYGTQSGTAEEFSNRLGQAARRFALSPFVCDVEELDWDSLTEVAAHPAVVIFVFATYGEGEPTDSAVDFFEWLTESAPDRCMAGLRFTVFGLGDKTYEHYQFMGREIDKHVKRLGGSCVYKRGEGDEDGQQEEDFMSWQEELWPTLVSVLQIDVSAADTSVARAFTVVSHTPEQLAAHTEAEAKRLARVRVFDQKHPYTAPVTVNEELHGPASDRSCRHVSISLAGTTLKYTAGDHLGVFPRNDPELVAALGARLGLDLDAALSLVPTEVGPRHPPFPGPCTLRHALSRYFDLTSPPSRYMLQALSETAAAAEDKASLAALASNASDAARERYHDFIQTAQRDLLQVLLAFPSVRPDLARLLEMLPKLAPRYYSISSSPKAGKDAVTITAVVLRYTTAAGMVRRGVCTNWIAARAAVPSPTLEVFVRASKFRLPADPAHAVIMIGPGTGLAPFRGFLQDRAADRAAGVAVGPMVLFFGCRAPDSDYLYRGELEGWAADGLLSHLFVAFSRLPAPAKKVYVQALIREQAAMLWTLLNGTAQASLYICGDARSMAADVRSALEYACRTEGGLTLDDARAFLDDLAKKHRMQLDVW